MVYSLINTQHENLPFKNPRMLSSSSFVTEWWVFGTWKVPSNVTFCVNYQRQITRQRQASLWLLNEISPGNSLSNNRKILPKLDQWKVREQHFTIFKDTNEKIWTQFCYCCTFGNNNTVHKSSTQGQTHVLQSLKEFQSCNIPSLPWHEHNFLTGSKNPTFFFRATQLHSRLHVLLRYILYQVMSQSKVFCFTDSGKQTRSSFSLMSNIHLMLGRLEN